MSSFHKDLALRFSESPPSTPDRNSTTVGTPYRSLTAPDAPIKWSLSGLFSTPAQIPGNSTPAIPTTPTKRAGPIDFFNKLADYDEVVNSIIRLDAGMWLKQGATAVIKEKLRNRKGAETLQQKLAQAFEAAARAQFVFAEILRECPSLDPDSYAFQLFKTLTLASLLKDNPSLADQLKVEAGNPFSNYGYKNRQEWIDEVAHDARGVIGDVEIACAQDDKYTLGDGYSLRKCLVAMSHHFDHNYVRLCNMYPEYAKIPKLAPAEVITSRHGRPVRERRTRRAKFEDAVMKESAPTRTRFTRSQYGRNPDFDNYQRVTKVAQTGKGTSYHGRPIRERHARKLEYNDIIKGDAMSWM